MAVQPQQALRPLTVVELNTRIHDLLSARFQSVLVKGEVSGVSLSRGHTWFTLKDGRAAVSAVIFGSTARRLPFLPEDGQELIVTAQVDFHVPSGRLSLVVLKLDYDGAGKLRERIEQLKRRLEAEGAFRPERRRSLPFLPRCVALVTSPSGAVIHDLQQTIWDRFPNTRLILYPAQVQGLASQRSLCAALKQCDRDGIADVCIVARGGGSFEELIAFNQEPVVRAIQAMGMPVVTALGHTSDRTLADLVADREARTPTAAAEVVVPRKAELLRQLEDRRSRLQRAGTNALVAPRMQLSSRQRDLEREARAIVSRRQERLQDLIRRVRLHDPREVLRRREANLGELRTRVERALARLLRDHALALDGRAQRLRSLGPQETLSRGYSICLDGRGRVVRAASEIDSGASVSVLLYSGRLECSVNEVRQ